ncbi:AraC family transcriptional regulator [Roseibium algae]|uniref:AraC family transcriptional regulator ligand-binding domain-containing protein n=1 Tax=Roseibium algae TaxID=3123038 RepID=A0ABU8TIM3_9HYPH
MSDNTYKIIGAAYSAARQHMTESGFDWNEIADHIGFDPDITNDQEKLQPFDKVLELYEYFAELTGSDSIGLCTGVNPVIGSGFVADYLGLIAPSVGEAMENWQRYQNLISNSFSCTLEYEGSCRYICWEFPKHLGSQVQYAGRLMGFVVARLRYMLDNTKVVLSVELAHEEPKDIDTYQAVLGPNLKFNAARHRVGVPVCYLNTVPPKSDGNLYKLMKAIAEARIEQQKADLGPMARIYDTVSASLKDGRPDLQSISDTLGMSTRSLQRTLEAEGLTFRELLDQVRKALAVRYLADKSKKINEVAYLLGYSDLSAFSRAAKGWFGVSPREYRRQK